MKKQITLFVACLALIFSANAAPVNATAAQKVAGNFFSQISTVAISQVNLVYTATDQSNNTLYYVFNINSNDGFVIVSADDILYPIIGYSTEKRPYAIPAKGTTVDFWMESRKTEISTDLNSNLTATADITSQWTDYTNNVKHSLNVGRVLNSQFPSNSAYLVQSTWDQPSPYNDDCPGVGANQAVTGCVATTMCQIMRYWQYPSLGQGSNSYNAGSYGNLTANFNHAYAWANMPLTNPSNSDTMLARAMSDAGISVDMSYSPSGSGAFVITQDDPVCAQNSYVQYFGYNATLIDGRKQFHSLTPWQDTLKHELDCNRPVEYVGSDPVQGGHTWVCDGYDASNNFHMNWGWSGLSDGWYSLSSLNPAGFNFSQGHEALIGIMPPKVTSAPVAAFSSSSPSVCIGNSVQFMDISSNQPTSWSWTFTGGTPATSTAQNPIVTYSSTGTFAVQLKATNSFGNNTVTSNSYVTINPAMVAPTVQQAGTLLSCVPATYSTYQWYKSGVIIPGATTSQITVSQRGDYSVFVTNPEGCSVTSPMLQVLNLGVNNITSENDVTVYPNPANGVLNVSLDLQEQGNYALTLTNVLGQTVYTDNIQLNGKTNKTIDVSNFGKGVYILSIAGQNNRIVKHVVLN